MLAADLEVVYRDPASLAAYEKNTRLHTPEQIRLIRRSMEEFGVYNPILLRDDETTIGAGHARQAAALLKPALARVPTIVLRGLSDEQWRALVIADNKIAITGSSWDDGLLRAELGDLKGLGFDLSLTGFASLELNTLFAKVDGVTDPDDEPEALPQPVSQLSDLWRCGEHWLVCGDATDPAAVEQVLGGAKPSLLVTDQPYGTNYRAGSKRGGEYLRDGAKRARGEVRNDTRADWREAWALAPCDVAYLWHNPMEAAVVQAGLEATGFELRAQIIWAKSSHVISGPNGHYHWRHEAAYYAVRKGAKSHWNGSRKEATLWEYPRPKKSETGHSTQKPVELFKRPIENNSAPGDHVYDPFLGAGAALIAAQMTKRVCHGVEIAPEHLDRALLRFQLFSGLAPILAETGETFDEVKVRRAEVV